MIVTVSDENGIKQYNVSKHIKLIFLGFLFLVSLVIGSLSFYVKSLHDKLSFLEQRIKLEKIVEKANDKSIIYLTKDKKLKNHNQRLLTSKLVQPESEKRKESKEKKLKQKVALQLAKLEKKREKEKAEKKRLAKLKKIEKKKRKERIERDKKKKILKLKALKRAKLARLKKEKLKKEKLAKQRKLERLKKANKKKKVTSRANSLPTIAKSKLGKRYVWGAVGPSVFDCSGFTSYVYKKKGITIPRTSRQQSKYGRLVDRKHLRPGDLIFFDTSHRRKGIVNHVGMYIGNNQFIHASSAKKRVVITNLSNFYSQRFKWARRIIH